VNYVKADKLLRTADGAVRGVVLRDVAPGEGKAGRTAEIEARVVINATGAWADDLRSELGQPKRLRKIRGSHLTFKADRLPLPEAVSLLHPRDQRAVFAIPWEGVTIFGTTDVDHGALDAEPAISQGETEYLLEALQKAFPALELSEKDVISTWSGVRPVIDTGKSDPSKESREHAIWREDGLLTITGGKLTTFAVMARDALAAAEDVLGELQPRTRVLEPNEEDISWPEHLDEAGRVRLLGRFGAEIGALLADREHARPIDGSIALWSELRYAARDEAIVTLSDLLLRRVRIGLLLPNGGMDEVAKIRALAQPELGWDDARWEREEAAYRATWKAAYSAPR
jgi:glycerol-3-phosphate dehydrogenase